MIACLERNFEGGQASGRIKGFEALSASKLNSRFQPQAFKSTTSLSQFTISTTTTWITDNPSLSLQQPASSSMEIQIPSTSSLPARESRVARNARSVHPMQDVAEQPPQGEPLLNVPSYFLANQTVDLHTPPAAGSGSPTHRTQEPSHTSHVEAASATVLEPTPRQPSATLSQDLSSLHAQPPTNVILAEADFFGDILGGPPFARLDNLFNPSRSLSQGSFAVPTPSSQSTPQVSKYYPSEEEKAVLKRKAESLLLPDRRHLGLTVSRGHEELTPPLKRVYRDDIDLFFYVFARWAFKVDLDVEAAKRMYDVLAKFQTQTDFVDRQPVSPPPGHAAQNGHDLGRMIARRAFQTNKEWLLPAISHLFSTSLRNAEQALGAMGEEDYVAYTEWGPASWMDAQLREKFFFEQASKSLEYYHVGEMEERRGPTGEVVDAGDDENRGEDYNDGEGRMLMDEEVTEASEYMDFLFIKTSGASFQL
ncbi:hypothetical protein DL98DRAFT_576690 [Cadophora sp. DSE1049]|nr:hypothetical protein DL98DRAFT_576690 [Cadophora sp. DSE1049]